MHLTEILLPVLINIHSLSNLFSILMEGVGSQQACQQKLTIVFISFLVQAPRTRFMSLWKSTVVPSWLVVYMKTQKTYITMQTTLFS